MFSVLRRIIKSGAQWTFLGTELSLFTPAGTSSSLVESEQ